MSADWEVRSGSAAETRRLGAALGGLLRGGDCVALDGDLGAGKTTFCGGIGDGLAVDEPLRSPSYLLCHEATGRHPVLHLDAYFEARLQGLLEEGLASRFDAATVVLVEWAPRMGPWLPPERLEARLEALEGVEDGRRFRFRAVGARARQLLEGLQEAWKSAAGA